jgi:hypothetical protein
LVLPSCGGRSGRTTRSTCKWIDNQTKRSLSDFELPSNYRLSRLSPVVSNLSHQSHFFLNIVTIYATF